MIVLSQTQAGQYAVDALDIVSGARIWDAVLPYTNEQDIWPGIESSNPFQYLGNTMKLAFIRVPGVLIAIDGVSGQVAWQWPIPFNTTLSGVTGWDDGIGLYVYATCHDGTRSLLADVCRLPFSPLSLSRSRDRPKRTKTTKRQYSAGTTDRVAIFSHGPAADAARGALGGGGPAPVDAERHDGPAAHPGGGVDVRHRNDRRQ